MNELLSAQLPLIFAGLGHLSFALTFWSYAQSNLIQLRSLAVASLFLGLAYNGWVHWHMPQGQGIALVLFWLTAFCALNIGLLIREIRSTLEISLPMAERELLVQTFPTMHSRDWAALARCAVKRTFSEGTQVLNQGAPTESLSVIVSGSAIEYRGAQSRRCAKGTLWGEITLVLGDTYFNASPVRIVAESQCLVVLEWPYPVIRALAEKNLRMKAAMLHGFVHSAGLKHGLLWQEPAPVLQEGAIREPSSRSLEAVAVG